MTYNENFQNESKIKKGALYIDEAYVKECDREFEETLSQNVKALCKDGAPRVIGLTGPTCSGKTTAAKKLISHLGDAEKVVHVISLDDFYKDTFSRADLEAADISKVDFDSPDTLDIELFERFVNELFTTGSATKPIFDFKTGERSRYESFSSDDDDVFIFEGIQVLYPTVLSVIERMGGVVMCVCPTSSIEVEGKIFAPDFIRLCRRIVRDYNFRGSSSEFTLTVWEGVRKNEDVNIFPYFERCDIMIDTVLPYELNILAPYLRRILSDVGEKSLHYGKAQEILSAFEGIEGIDSGAVGDNSLYKEFV